MFDLAVMALFFLTAVIRHLNVCRRYTGSGLLLMPFIKISLLHLCLMGVVIGTTHKFFMPEQVSIWSLSLWMSVTAIYLFLIPIYLVFYFSTQQVSPTKKILLLLNDQGPLSKTDLLKYFTNEEFIVPRIKELKQIQCIVEHGGWYILTPQGIRMAKLYCFYQWVLGRPKGG